MAPVRNRNRR